MTKEMLLLVFLKHLCHPFRLEKATMTSSHRTGMSSDWLFHGALFNLLMNQYKNIHLYVQKIWTLKLNFFQRRPKN